MTNCTSIVTHDSNHQCPWWQLIVAKSLHNKSKGTSNTKYKAVTYKFTEPSSDGGPNVYQEFWQCYEESNPDEQVAENSIKPDTQYRNPNCLKISTLKVLAPSKLPFASTHRAMRARALGVHPLQNTVQMECMVARTPHCKYNRILWEVHTT